MAALEEEVKKPQVVKVSMNSLKRDFKLYPRVQVDVMTVERFKDAMRAGAKFPPIRACAETGRIIDGFHRYMAYSELGYEYADAVAEEVESDADFFMRAVAANRAHGLGYAIADHEKIAKLVHLLGLEREKVALAMALPVQKLDSLLRATPKPLGEPFKIGEAHRRSGGHRMDSSTADINRPQRQSVPGGYYFFFSQITEFLLSDRCDLTNPDIASKVRDLGDAIQKKVNPSGQQFSPLVLPEPVKEWLAKRAGRESKTLVALVVELLTRAVETEIQGKRDAGMMSAKDGAEWAKKLKPYSVINKSE